MYRTSTRRAIAGGLGKTEAIASPTGWWTVDGSACIGAWQAKGADDYASSKTDLSGSGNNLTAPGTDPSWNSSDGWTNTVLSEYLDTGITPVEGYSIIVRFSGGAVGYNCPMGSHVSGARLYFFSSYPPTSLYGSGGSAAGAGQYTSGVMCVAGQQGYYNGSADGGTISAWTTTNPYSIYILTRNSSSGSGSPLVGSVQAAAVYNRTLTSGEVSALSDEIAAL